MFINATISRYTFNSILLIVMLEWFMLMNMRLYNFEHLINIVAEDGNNLYYSVIVYISFVCDATFNF